MYGSRPGGVQKPRKELFAGPIHPSIDSITDYRFDFSGVQTFFEKFFIALPKWVNINPRVNILRIKKNIGG